MKIVHRGEWKQHVISGVLDVSQVWYERLQWCSYQESRQSNQIDDNPKNEQFASECKEQWEDSEEE